MVLQTRYDSPSSLQDQVEKLIRSKTGGMIRDLRVNVQDEEIVLSGRTNTYYMKQLATHATLDFVQGAELTNQIEVY